MFEPRELKAMAYGYAVTIPLGLVSIYLGAPIQMAVIIFSLGFLITLVKLNSEA